MSIKIVAGEYKRGDVFLVEPSEVVVDNEWNSRSFGVDQEYVNLLAKSFRQYGQKQPVVVRVLGDKRIKLVAGFCRWHAAKKLQDEGEEFRLACIVTKANDDEAFEENLVENFHRKNLSAMEEAMAMARLEKRGVLQNEIAEKLGCSEGHVSSRLSLLNLSPALRQELHLGNVAVTDAYSLAKIADESRQWATWQKMKSAANPTERKKTANEGAGKTTPRKVSDVRECAGALIGVEVPAVKRIGEAMKDWISGNAGDMALFNAILDLAAEAGHDTKDLKL